MKTLFNKSKKIRNLFNIIRNLKINENNIINIPQPGLFLGNKYLFIAQNPGIPREDKNPSDKILLKKDVSDEEFHEAYKQSQFNWLFYKRFIKSLIENNLDFSITNVCFFPTADNSAPSQKAIDICRLYLRKMIHILNPKNIIILSSLAKRELNYLNFKVKYNILYSQHYSFLLRSGKLNSEISRLKMEIR